MSQLDFSKANPVTPGITQEDIAPLGYGFAGDIGPVESVNPSSLQIPNVGTALEYARTRELNKEGLVRQEAERLSQTMRTLRNSLNADPYELSRLSRESGLSPAIVDDDPAFARKKTQSDAYWSSLMDFQRNADLSPETLRFLTQASPADALSILGDKGLTLLESEAGQEREGYTSGLFGTIGTSWDVGMLQREMNELYGREFWGATLDPEQEQRLRIGADVLGMYGREQEKMPLWQRAVWGTVSSLGVPLSGMITEGAKSAPWFMAAGTASGALFGSAAGGVGAVPGAIAGGLAGLGKGLLAGGALDTAKQEAFSIYGALRDLTDAYGERVDPAVARTLASVGGILNAGLEFVGLRSLAGIFPGLEKLVSREAAEKSIAFLQKNPTVAAKFGQGILKALQGIAGEVGTELAQETVSIAAEELAKNFSHVDRPSISGAEFGERLLDTAVKTGEAMLIPGILGGGLSIGRNLRFQQQYDQALASDNRLKDVFFRNIVNSALFRELPDTGQEMVRALSESGALPSEVYIRPEAVQRIFFQSGVEGEEQAAARADADMDAVASELGITPERLEESLTLGTDIAVSTDLAARHIFTNEGLYSSLRGDMRFTPELPTDAELEDLRDIEADAVARMEYVDNIFGGLAEEENAALDRMDARRELVKPYAEQLTAAGYTSAQADAYGMILGASAERLAPAFGMTPQEWLQERLHGFFGMTPEEFQGLRDLDEAGMRQSVGALYQPVLPSVNPDERIPIVDLSGVKPLSISGKGARAFVNRWKGAPLEIGRNPDGKITVRLSSIDPDHAFWSSEILGRNDATRRAALDGLDSVLAGAVRIEDTAPKHRGVDKTIRFYVPVSIDGSDPVALRIVAHEMAGQKAEIQGVELYDIIKEKPDSQSARTQQRAGTVAGQSDVSEITIREMLSGVKDAQGKAYFQKQARNARGAIRRLDDGRYIVGLFKKKDLSTVLHESAHFWLEQLREAAGLESAPDWVRESWSKLQQTYGFDDTASGEAWRGVQERFARDFEAYAREGKAPSNELQAAFNKFRNWLTDIYVHIRRLLGDKDLSEDVREVFDRLLATEEENATLNRLDARRELVKPYAAQLTAAGYTPAQADAYGTILGASAERLAPAFGMTPGEWLQERLSGFFGMTLEEFQGLRAIEDLDNERAIAESDFAERVMAPHDQFEADMRQGGGALYQAIESPDSVGGITPEIAEQVGIRPGALTLGEAASKHIEDRHGAQLRELGYSDAQEFVRHVLSHVDAVYQGNTNRDFDFVAREQGPHGRVLTKIEFERDGDRYAIKTAGPIRPSFYDGKTPLWEGAQALAPDEAPLAARHASRRGQSGERLNLTKDGETIKTFLQSNNAADARGAIRHLDDGRYIVGLFKKKDLSTVLHESAHFWLEQLREAAALESAPEWVRESWGKLQAAYGFDDTASGEAWRGVQERFARDFEAYAREGKAPSNELQAAFNKFRNWLTDIYVHIRRLLGDKDLSEDVREVFDRLLATEGENAAQGRMDARRELVKPYVEQLTAAGYTPAQADAYGTILGASAERLAPAFGMTPQEWLKERLSGFFGMTPEEFQGLRAIEDLDNERAIAESDFAERVMAPHDQFEADMRQGGGALYQPSIEEIRAGDEALARDSEAWGKSVDAFMADTLPTRQPVTMLNQTPLVLQMLGAENRPIITSQEVLKKILIAKHGLAESVVKQVPAALADPVMVFRPDTVEGETSSARNDSLVVMLDLKDEHGATVIVPVALEQRGQQGYMVNVATSMYPKNNPKTKKPRDGWFLGQIEKGNLLYQNIKKSSDWMRTAGLRVPEHGNMPGVGASNSGNSSSRAWAAMVGLQLPPTHRSSSARQILRTDADLVKLRGANPALYQTAPPIESAAFKNWFGESKAVDENGAPMVLYHGTYAGDIEAFDPTRSNPHNAYGDGIYLAETPEKAALYGDIIYPVYIRAERDRRDAKRTGLPKDHIHNKENGIWVVYDPAQIKSVHNRGTFDGNDPRILYQSFESPDSVGGITPEISEKVGIRQGALTLTEEALKHIEKNHGEQIHSLGYADAQEFVRHVLSNVEAVYQGNSKRTFDFVTERASAQNKRVLARIEFEAKGDRYEIKTAGPVRTSYYAEKVPLWEGARPSSQIETPSATRRASQRGQSEERLDLTKDGETVKTFLQSNNAADARGAIRRLDDGRYIVGLFRKKDFSTVLHESAHFWLEQLREAAGLESAPDWVRESWSKLQQTYGFDDTASGEAWRGVQERFARDFEAYAREGKAPSNELQAAFNKFRNWLTDIYVHIRRLLGDKDLSEDVREVFDRLLATEEEIQVSRRAVPQNVMAELGDAASPELHDRYAQAAQKAYDNASALIAARRLVEQRRVEKEFREAATEKVDADSFYRLVAAIREEGGISFDAMKEVLPEDTAYALRDKWRERGIKGFIKKQGVLDMLDVAARFNQDSAINLAGLLLDAPSRGQAIEAETQRALAEWESDFDGSIEYSSAMDEALAVELEALTGRKQVSPSVLRAEFERRVGIRKSAEVDAEYAALKASLRKRNSVLRVALKEWRASANAEALEARDAARARLAGVREQERLKHAALGAAYRARIERDAIVRQVRRAASSTSVEYAYQQQILRLVAHWKGLGTPAMAPRDVQGIPSFQEFIAGNVGLFPDEEGLIADWIYAESGRGKAAYLSDLSLEQLRDVQAAVKVLGHKGRQYGRLIAQGRNTEARLAVDAMRESADRMSAATLISERDREEFFGKVRGFLRGAVADLTAVDMLCRALNGYSKDGPFTQYIVLPLRRAMSAEFRMKRAFDVRLAAVLAPLARGGSGKAFQIAGVPLPDDVAAQWGGLFDRDKVISVALNMGNTGNLKAVMRGYGWSESDLRAVTAGMTVAEWQAIQNVWDMIDELYPGLAGTYERIHGVPLAKVRAQAFTVRATDGVISLKGGYYPLIFDRNFSRQAEDDQTRDEIMNRMEAITRTAHPKSGMTNERKGGTLPPKLSLRVLQQHIADTIHYTTHAKALRDVAQLTRRADFKTMFERAAGVENYQLLLPWLQHIARPGTEMLTQYDKMAEWMARRGSLVALALNMKTALMQLTSFGNSMNEIGAGQFMKGVYQMMSRGRTAYDEVRAKSAYMESRSRNFDASIAEQLERFSPLGAGGVSFMGRCFTLRDVQDSQLALIQALDAVVSYPTWIGAYDAAISKGMAEEDAISSADDAVIAAQSSGAAMDTPSLLRGRGFIKLFSAFMSFANRDFNRKKYYAAPRVRDGSNPSASATRHLALEWALPVVLPVLILSLGRDGELPEGEEFAWEALGFATMGIPFLRDAVRAIDALSTGKGYGTRMGGSIKELVNTMGFFTGIGTPQIWRTMAGSEAYFVDDEGGPLAPLLGKPKK